MASKRRLCECGCGQEVREGKRFVHGHNSRGSSNPNWKGGTRLCECGCGQRVKKNCSKYIYGHQWKKGSAHASWKGGKYICPQGYVYIHMPDHHRADSRGYVREHVLVMEGVLKRPILKTEDIHHIDEKRSNNEPGNLMVFHKKSGHRMYHGRLEAFKATGKWDWLKCCYCKKYDEPSKMTTRKPPQRSNYHNSCRAEYEKARLQRVREKT